MHILDKIVAHKRKEVEIHKLMVSINELERSTLFNKTKINVKQAFENGGGIIAEFKRKSPSKPQINLEARSQNIVTGYEKAGATASSILTDEYFFGGSKDDITDIREQVSLPILRKDFIIDEYQILEAKAIGADIILLIAEILTKDEVQLFAKLANSLNLSILFEIHTVRHLDKFDNHIDMIGVNNRDLTTFEVDYSHSLQLFKRLPSDVIKISESGISKIEIIKELRACGYNGFLIGEAFMKSKDPAAICHKYVEALNS